MQEVVINGKSSKNVGAGLEIIDWQRQILPESRDELEYVDGIDGPVHNEKPLGSRIISITFRAYFSNEEEKAAAQGDVASWLYSRGFTKFEVDDEPNIYYMAKVLDDTELDPELFTAEFTIVFTCKPLKYGAFQTKSGAYDGLSFENAGTYESPPVINLSLNINTNNFSFTLNGVSITYESTDAPLSAGDQIKIDCKKLEFRVNGNLKVIEVDGYFPVVINGANNASCNTDSTITIDWQELYL